MNKQQKLDMIAREVRYIRRNKKMFKPNIFTDLRNTYLLSLAIAQFKQECIWCWYIHTGVRPGNRKQSTYFRYLRNLGWSVEELRQSVLIESPESKLLP